VTAMGTSNILHRTSNGEQTPGGKYSTFNVFRFVVTLFLLFQFSSVVALAADKLRVDILPTGPRVRNEAPVPVEVKFNWDSARLLEGRLEMEFHEGNRVLGRYRSGDLALSGGEQRFRMLLPPVVAPFSDSQVEVRMRFVTAANTIDLDPSVLILPTANERSLVIAWCNSAAGSGAPPTEAMQTLLLEHYAPPSENVSTRLLTGVARLTPEDLPAQPLGYTPFDVVVLTADAFKETGERQLQALARWVRGGGSVCVFAGGGLRPHHVSFLNQLNDSFAGLSFQADNAGKLLAARGGIVQLRSGLGRCVIVAGENLAEAGLKPSDWRAAAAFLWKMRNRQARAVAESGYWESSANPAMPNNYNLYYSQRAGRVAPNYVPPSSYAANSDSLGAELLSRLMPQTVRLIPFSALIGLLALFVVMIGPADYFVLGALRRRKFTWILFPAVSIAFTVATVLMANHYLGLRDQRRSLFVVDLAKDGSALRWNQYELVFAARDRQSVTELKDALWAPLEARQMVNQPYVQVIRGRQVMLVPNNPYNSGYGYNANAEGGTEPPLFTGVLPVHFQSRKMLRQWQPELNRIFSFESPPVPLIPNWDAVEKTWPNLQEVRAKLSGTKPFTGDVFALGKYNSITADSGSSGIVPAEILNGLCGSDSVGLKSVVSQISPTGGSGFEDAQVLDSDANDSALVIVTQMGDDLVVYRRFFYGK